MVERDCSEPETISFEDLENTFPFQELGVDFSEGILGLLGNGDRIEKPLAAIAIRGQLDLEGRVNPRIAHWEDRVNIQVEDIEHALHRLEYPNGEQTP